MACGSPSGPEADVGMLAQLGVDLHGEVKGVHPGHGGAGVEVVVRGGGAVAVGVEPVQVHVVAQLQRHVHSHNAAHGLAVEGKVLLRGVLRSRRGRGKLRRVHLLGLRHLGGVGHLALQRRPHLLLEVPLDGVEDGAREGHHRGVQQHHLVLPGLEGHEELVVDVLADDAGVRLEEQEGGVAPLVLALEQEEGVLLVHQVQRGPRPRVPLEARRRGVVDPHHGVVLVDLRPVALPQQRAAVAHHRARPVPRPPVLRRQLRQVLRFQLDDALALGGGGLVRVREVEVLQLAQRHLPGRDRIQRDSGSPLPCFQVDGNVGACLQ
mmetsp:Transcript_9301/g.19172  ORF Transcript_9301/g.19172 Transcript_9301/m.19172 type:complete len:322 (-) Transcript_9301:696-1661(-)